MVRGCIRSNRPCCLLLVADRDAVDLARSAATACGKSGGMIRSTPMSLGHGHLMMLTAGATLGPYEILARVGAGGMGEVYKAHDTRLNRTVAIKVLPAALTADPDARLRLNREAKAVAALSHPHICSLFDIGHQDGTDFLVMEFLEGETLAERLTRGKLPLDEALRTGIQIADSLATAHKAGIIHRDLKPGNIMLTRRGATLLDFGLAKPPPWH